jgi:hypothetical protein
MTSKYSERGWIATVRNVLPWFLRNRHYASINPPATPQKLEPIARIVADAGRNSTTPAD